MRISDWSSDVCSSDFGEGRESRVPPVLEAAQVAGLGREAVLVLVVGAEHVVEAPAVVVGREPQLLGKGLLAVLAHRRGHRPRVVVVEAQPAVLGVEAGVLAGDVALVVVARGAGGERGEAQRSEEHTSELQSLMRISYAVFCL